MTSESWEREDRLELWGGVECTVNRVANVYHDQLELTGHDKRLSDIDRIADLGIRVARYPFLWERVAPLSIDDAEWAWPDARMNRLRERGITPIVGLVHHGSGPRRTHLLDDAFPRRLADYAAAVARRYPDIRYVTPVNEPLTTARFAGLYGHWYPHQRSPQSFAHALLNQCAAVHASMRAMREVIPHIRLVQTEDLPRIYSTPALTYQADFENERRWLTFDLLLGRVDERHPMWRHIAVSHAATAILHRLRDDPCPPDILGLNYYVTSDRFLDDRLSHYDQDSIGGNGRHRYADVEAVRALEEGITGHARILREAWSRYGIPLAFTEVHLGCTREQQMRWLVEAWNASRRARAEGCDVRAVTAWALFGSFGWDSLVTKPPFNYEPGAFDTRSGEPRETGLAKVIRELLVTGECSHPAAKSPGWWKTDDRLNIAPVAVPARRSRRRMLVVGEAVRPVLIAGGRGTLGAAFVRLCEARGIVVNGATRADLDITNALAVRRTIEMLRPWAVINAAGFVRVDDAERERSDCYRINTLGVGILAGECARAGIPLLTFSSDLVFDGRKGAPYVESDRVNPVNTYGASKAAAELRAFELHSSTLVVRTSAFFGPWDGSNFITTALRTLADGLPFVAASDVIVSPTYVPDLVHASLDLLLDGESGIWHLANQGAVSWSELAREAASRAGLAREMVKEARADDLGRAARQPSYTALCSERCALLPTLDDAMDRYFSKAALPTLTAVTA